MSSGVAEVNGTRLYYEVTGSGRTVVFLHGFTLDRRMWNRQVEALSARYRVVVYDARGFGQSAPPAAEPYRHCDDAAALCEQLGLGRVLVVGHSIGAHQMLEFALARPDLVAGWAGVCTSGLADVPFPDDVMKLFAAVRAAAREDGVDAAKRTWSRAGWFSKARAAPVLERELDAMLADYSGWHWLNDNPAVNLVPPAAERLASLDVPALVVTGAQDLHYNTIVGQKLTSGIPGATALHVPGAGHMANMEEPEAVNRALAALADRVFAE